MKCNYINMDDGLDIHDKETLEAILYSMVVMAHALVQDSNIQPKLLE